MKQAKGGMKNGRLDGPAPDSFPDTSFRLLHFE
jgi:hypothetical protein